MSAPEAPDWEQPAPADWSTALFGIAVFVAVAVALIIVFATMSSASQDSADAPPPDGGYPVVTDEQDDEPAVDPSPSANPVARADPEWVARVASATGIPSRALAAYGAASLAIDAEQPGCGIGWSTLAAIGLIESGHGSHDGAVLRDDGLTEPRIIGPQLNGVGSPAIADSDGGRWDGDTVWDRAVGPLQFIPDTWRSWGADGSGDGVADPNQIDDAALAAARYLCAGGPVATMEDWRAAILSYNHVDSYVDAVAAAAKLYSSRAG